MTSLSNPPSRFPTDRGKSAVALVASGALDNPIYLENGHAQRLVPSCTNEGSFYVTDATSCTCPDAQYRKSVCKHQIAVRLAYVLELAEQENQPAVASHSNGRVIPASQIERED